MHFVISSLEKNIIILRKMRRQNESLNFSSVEESSLEILLKGLDHTLACEIKELWIDPSAFTVEHFLGKGITVGLLCYISNCLVIKFLTF